MRIDDSANVLLHIFVESGVNGFFSVSIYLWMEMVSVTYSGGLWICLLQGRSDKRFQSAVGGMSKSAMAGRFS